VLPVTVANATNLKTSLCDLNDSVTACELMLFMFDLDDDAWNVIFKKVDKEDYEFFDSFSAYPDAYAIDPMMLDNSNMNLPSLG